MGNPANPKQTNQSSVVVISEYFSLRTSSKKQEKTAFKNLFRELPTSQDVQNSI